MKKTIKKIIIFFFLFLLFGIILLTVHRISLNTPKQKVTRALGINASTGKVISHTDTHGGFHGDAMHTPYYSFSMIPTPIRFLQPNLGILFR